MCRIKNLKIEPFAKFSAEEEIDDLNGLFYKPPFFNELINLLEAGNSRFILGQRGQGKSAVILKLQKDLSEKQVLTILITRFDNIPYTDNAAHHLYQISSGITKEIVKLVFFEKSLVKRLSKDQKHKFNFLIEKYFDENWDEEFMNRASVIRAKKRVNWLKRLFNKNLKFLNKVAEGLVHLTSDAIRKSIFGDLPSLDTPTSDRKYFGEAQISDFKSVKIGDVQSYERPQYIKEINFLIELAKVLKKKSVIILFDKIDENQSLSSDVNKITEFMLDLLGDTDFLYTKHLGIAFALWNEVKLNLNKRNIRFDKFKDIDIRWNSSDMENLINHRLLYYSKDTDNPVTLASLVPNNLDRQEILNLSGNSPRNLISLLSSIYYADSNSEITSFSNLAISTGMLRFCKGYDYISHIPSNHSKRDDLYNWLNKILALRKSSFSIQDYMVANSVKSATANNHITELKKLGMVKNSSIPASDGSTIFTVCDPRICYLQKRGILNIE